MTILDQTKPDEARAILRKVCDEIMGGRTWAQSMATVGGSEALAFKWLDQARAAERADDKDSVFYLDWSEGTPPAYWNRLAFKARARRSIVLESVAVSGGIHGHEEIVIVDGRVCYAEEEKFIGRDDDWVALYVGCELKDVPYHRIKRDAEGRPVPLTRIVRPSAALTNKLLEGLLPEVYGQKVQHDVRSENVVRVVGPTFSRDANAQPKQLPAPNENDSALVRDLKEKLAAGVKYKFPQDAQGRRIPVNDGTVRNVIEPDNPKIPRPDVRDNPRAYQADPITETVKSPTLDYGRAKPPPHIGRGKIEPGGFDVTNKGTYR